MPALDLVAGYGLTDSEIKNAASPTHIGNEVPFNSHDTANVGIRYQRRVRPPYDPGGAGLSLLVRADYRRIGDTYWSPASLEARDPVNVVDFRIGIGGASWALMIWARNAGDTTYNAEFSPFEDRGLAVQAPPLQIGIDLSKSFSAN